MIGLVVLMLVAAWSIHRIVERPVSRLLRRGLVAGLRELREGGEPAPRAEVTRDKPAAVVGAPLPVVPRSRSGQS
jgi:peptidoglycan/LPS O-acetylase OafA/YrhL